MKITITRHIFTNKCTMGMLDMDGVFQCYTLEPPMRPEKPYCIPAGTYKVKMLPSVRFQTVLPHVQDVPGFTGIEWHAGNFPEDTEGCLLVGKHKGLECVANSKSALAELISKLPAEFEATYL